MKALLDTQAFLWWNESGGARVSPPAAEIILDPGNEILLSVASAWEISIKVANGRLQLPESVERYIPERIERHSFRSLPIELTHAMRISTLPHIHRDPFDRLLVAQAQIEGLPILTADPVIARYDVETIW